MNKKIKIIELLNKIANEEIEDKQKFRVHFKNGLTRDIYYKKIYGKNISSLCNWYDNYTFQDEYDLDDEVEILEDNTEEIEELDRNLKFDDLITPYGRNEDLMWTEIIKQHNKINEIIRELNKIRKEKE